MRRSARVSPLSTRDIHQNRGTDEHRQHGSILDTAYEIEPDGEETVLRMSKVAVGPMTHEQAGSISDLRRHRAF